MSGPTSGEHAAHAAITARTGRTGRTGRAGLGASLALIARHQAGALITTAVDFAAMIAAVELLHLRPSHGTLVGALIGALTNYTLGRYWIFDRRHTLASPKRWQGLRYALVSATSLGLNGLGVHALAELAGVQFVLARTLVAVLVSVGWNFPMHRYFVYRAPRRAVEGARAGARAVGAAASPARVVTRVLGAARPALDHLDSLERTSA